MRAGDGPSFDFRNPHFTNHVTQGLPLDLINPHPELNGAMVHFAAVAGATDATMHARPVGAAVFRPSPESNAGCLIDVVELIGGLGADRVARREARRSRSNAVELAVDIEWGDGPSRRRLQQPNPRDVSATQALVPPLPCIAKPSPFGRIDRLGSSAHTQLHLVECRLIRAMLHAWEISHFR